MAGAGDFLSGMAGGMQTGMSINRMRDEKQQRDQEREIDEQRRQQEEEAAKRQEELRQQNQQQPSGQQGMGIDPSMAQSFMSNGSSSSAAAGGSGSLFGGAGGSAGGASGTGAMGLPTSYTGYLGGSSAAGGSTAGGSAGGSSMGGAAAAAGPWAALAAVIAVNEKSARNGGHRRDGWQYGKDLIGGKVVEQDMNGRWAGKLGGYDDDKTGLVNDMGAGAEFTTGDFSNGFKKLTNAGTLNKIGKGIGKIFK